jgi:hypothetical protein
MIPLAIGRARGRFRDPRDPETALADSGSAEESYAMSRLGIGRARGRFRDPRDPETALADSGSAEEM